MFSSITALPVIVSLIELTILFLVLLKPDLSLLKFMLSKKATICFLFLCIQQRGKHTRKMKRSLI